VTGIGTRADEVVKREIQRRAEVGETLRDPRHVLRDRDAFGLGAVHVLQRVVIGAGLEPDLVAALPAVPGQDVDLHQFQRVPHVGASIDVRDRRRDVVASHRAYSFDFANERGSPQRKEAPESGASDDITYRSRCPDSEASPCGTSACSWLEA
jgi:hypothetical protein